MFELATILLTLSINIHCIYHANTVLSSEDMGIVVEKLEMFEEKIKDIMFSKIGSQWILIVAPIPCIYMYR